MIKRRVKLGFKPAHPRVLVPTEPLRQLSWVSIGNATTCNLNIGFSYMYVAVRLG